jgi:glucose-6-phosphate dehydrogenase assembly protein OpcA
VVTTRSREGGVEGGGQLQGVGGGCCGGGAGRGAISRLRVHLQGGRCAVPRDISIFVGWVSTRLWRVAKKVWQAEGVSKVHREPHRHAKAQVICRPSSWQSRCMDRTGDSSGCVRMDAGGEGVTAHLCQLYL